MNIKIKSVFTLLCVLLFYPVIGWTADVTLAWDPNTESSTAGYRLYAREAGESYNYAHAEWQGEDTQCTVSGFDEYEAYYFVLRAIDDQGNESGDSNQVYWNPSGTEVNSSLGDDDGAGGGGGGGSGGCFIRTLFGD
ncbi:MAG: fibronectin type III domain-containing protein [Desulfatitalea sp.]